MKSNADTEDATRLLRGTIEDNLREIFLSVAVNDAEFVTYAAARGSVLNFGVPGVQGKFWEVKEDRSFDVEELLASIKSAIAQFEPRIKMYEVRQANADEARRFSHQDSGTSVQVVIVGYQQNQRRVEVRGQVDLVTGTVELL